MNMEQQPKHEDIYLTLAGTVDSQMAQRVFNSLALATQHGVKRVHLLIHSSGGFIPDGIGLYNYLKNLPLEIYTYNAGQVSSIAVTVYLAGTKRFASATGSFMIHKSHISPRAGSTSIELRELAKSLAREDARVESILKGSINMPKRLWMLHSKSDLYLSSEEALSFGLINAIQDFCPPHGSLVYNI